MIASASSWSSVIMLRPTSAVKLSLSLIVKSAVMFVNRWHASATGIHGNAPAASHDPSADIVVVVLGIVVVVAARGAVVVVTCLVPGFVALALSDAHCRKLRARRRLRQGGRAERPAGNLP